MFKEIGNLPSLPALYTDPALTSFTNPFFSDAPVGTIFSDTAAQLQPQYLGTKNGPVRQAVENVVREVEAGSISADDGWNEGEQGGRESRRVIGRGTDRAPRAVRRGLSSAAAPPRRPSVRGMDLHRRAGGGRTAWSARLVPRRGPVPADRALLRAVRDLRDLPAASTRSGSRCTTGT